jgi:hypothetical protein
MYHSFNECKPENWAVDNLSLYPDDLHAKVRSPGLRTIVTPQIQDELAFLTDIKFLDQHVSYPFGVEALFRRDSLAWIKARP